MDAYIGVDRESFGLLIRYGSVSNSNEISLNWISDWPNTSSHKSFRLPIKNIPICHLLIEVLESAVKPQNKALAVCPESLRIP